MYLRKYLFVFYGVHITNNHTLFVVVNQLLDVLAEQTERRISNHNVGLLEQFDAFRASEVTVAFECLPLVVLICFELLGYVLQGKGAVLVDVADFVDDKAVGRYFGAAFGGVWRAYDYVFVLWYKRGLQY